MTIEAFLRYFEVTLMEVLRHFSIRCCGHCVNKLGYIRQLLNRPALVEANAYGQYVHRGEAMYISLIDFQLTSTETKNFQ